MAGKKRKDNLRLLHGSNEPNVMREGNKLLKEAMPEFREYLTMIAELTKIKYDALVKEGFLPEQALELAKNPLST